MRIFVAGSLFASMVLFGPACAEFSPSSAQDEAGASEGGTADAGDASSSCAESCDGRTACTLWDFSKGTCEPFQISSPDQGPVADCAAGKMRLAADSTLDLGATASRQPPTSGYSQVKVSFRLSAARWDGKPVIQINVAGTTLATMKIDDDRTGTLTAALCRASASDCVAPTLQIPASTEHVFTIDVDATSTRLTVDCTEVASFTTTSKLQVDAPLEVAFGHTDANAFDGTFDDVLVWFKP